MTTQATLTCSHEHASASGTPHSRICTTCSKSEDRVLKQVFIGPRSIGAPTSRAVGRCWLGSAAVGLFHGYPDRQRKVLPAQEGVLGTRATRCQLDGGAALTLTAARAHVNQLSVRSAVGEQ
jgi:hypothetical protein